MFEWVDRLAGALEGRERAEGARQLARMALGAALAVGAMTEPAFGQANPPPGPQPPGTAQTSAGPPGSSGQPNNPPPSYPPSAYQQPGYPPQQAYPPQQGYSPPPGYPPNYQQQGPQPPPQQPNYGQPPGYGGYSEPPLPPPPPKRPELRWSFRFDILNLLFGRATGEIEHAIAGPLSFTLVPEYIFADPAQSKADGVTASGGGIAGQLGYWVEGRPLRGYFIKAHLGYQSVTFKSLVEEVHVPATKLGAMFGSQSVYGGWFTLAAGIGVVYDFQAQDRPITTGYDSSARRVGYVIPATGLFGNGFDLLAQLAIGGSF